MGCAAVKHGHSVCYVNLEMSKSQIRHRSYAILTGEPVSEMTPGDGFDFGARDRTLERTGELVKEGTHFYANEHRLSKIDDIEGFMLRHLDVGCELFVVDYLQRVRSDSRTMLEKIIDTSIMVSDFSKTHGVVTVGVSQFTKEAADDFDDPPSIYDMRGSSQLIDDSVQVLLLDHSDHEEREVGGELGNPLHRRARTNIIVGKNRDGDTGRIPVEWNYQNLTISQRRGS